MIRTRRQPQHRLLRLEALLIVFIASVAVQGQPADHEGGIFPQLERSPYFIPGLSSVPFTFNDASSTTKAGNSGAFVVLGAVTRGLELNFVQAEQACQRIPGGKGLAIVNTDARKSAIDKALTHSRVRSISFLSHAIGVV